MVDTPHRISVERPIVNPLGVCSPIERSYVSIICIVIPRECPSTNNAEVEAFELVVIIIQRSARLSDISSLYHVEQYMGSQNIAFRLFGSFDNMMKQPWAY